MARYLTATQDYFLELTFPVYYYFFINAITASDFGSHLSVLLERFYKVQQAISELCAFVSCYI